MRGRTRTTSESLKEYFNAISDIPLLTKEEEIELFKRFPAGDDSIRKNIAEANQRLVVKIAKTHLGKGLSFGDLIGEGNVGLMRAIEKFDLSKKCRFATYAIHWIRQAVTRSIQEKAHTVRPPVDLTGQVPYYRKKVYELTEKLGRQPMLKEVARAMHMTPEKAGRLDKAEHALYGVKALPEFESIDTAPIAHNGVEPWVAADRAIEARDMVDVLMGAVTDREREILSLRFGLGGKHPMTLQEVGKRLNVTRARVGQIENRAMAKMHARMAESGEPVAAFN